MVFNAYNINMLNKNKIKLSLIDDYIKIIIIKNFFNNSYFEKVNTISCSHLIYTTQQLDFNLELIYNKIFDKLKLNNLSLIILKEELNSNNSLFLQLKKSNFINIANFISNLLKELTTIEQNLKQKTKSLKIQF